MRNGEETMEFGDGANVEGKKNVKVKKCFKAVA
jgi:hypothetical protein